MQWGIKYTRSTYDIQTSALEENILTTIGFLNLVKKVLRLQPGGLLWAGHPCCNMIFMSKSVHQRQEAAPWGNPKEPSFPTARKHVARQTCCVQFRLRPYRANLNPNPRCDDCKPHMRTIQPSALPRHNPESVECNRTTSVQRPQAHPVLYISEGRFDSM